MLVYRRIVDAFLAKSRRFAYNQIQPVSIFLGQQMRVRKTLVSLITITGILTISCVGIAQQTEQTAESIEVKSRLNYWLHLPTGYDKDKEKKWPLMLFLHGAGERGDNLEVVKKWGPPRIVQNKKDFPFILISPQCPSGRYWNIDHLKELLDQTIKNHNVDTQRIYLTGLSMGGYGSWALAAKHPKTFAAVAPICGGIDPESAEPLVDVPIWAFHGDADKVVPVSQSQAIVDAIKNKGGTKVTLTIYEGVGHNSWTETYANPKLYEWFLQHRRPN